jgi:glycosyltransferase involved in cell wall biosynthesis
MNAPDQASLVSVVIPSHNSEGTIATTVRSALNQSHANLEIIVADDGSTDGTLCILREIATTDPRVRIFEGEHSGHPGVVRNRALSQAGGRYIAFLDADDLWVATKLADQLHRLGDSPDADFCSTSARFLAPGQEPPPLETPMPESDSAPELRALPSRDPAAFERLLTRQRTIHTSSVLMTRALLESIGPFSEDPRLRSGQDDDFLFRAWRAGTPVTIPGVYVLVRRRPGSVSARNTWENVFELIAKAESREPLPGRLRRKAWSAAWIVRAERSLADPAAPWRRSMVEAWRLDPMNPRRIPALIAVLLPRNAARRFYLGLRDRWARSRA